MWIRWVQIWKWPHGKNFLSILNTRLVLVNITESTLERSILNAVHIEELWERVPVLPKMREHILKRNHNECHECGKILMYSFPLLNIREWIHTEEKLYEYNKCRPTLRERSTLSKHQRIHTGEQSYICNQCGKNFWYHSKFAEHQRIHTGKKTLCMKWMWQGFHIPLTSCWTSGDPHWRETLWMNVERLSKLKSSWTSSESAYWRETLWLSEICENF